jgi:hypothetical protein
LNLPDPPPNNPFFSSLMEIQRISSLDKFLNIVQENENDDNHDHPIDSLRILIKWWKKYLSLRKIQQNFLMIDRNIQRILDTIETLISNSVKHEKKEKEEITFEQTQDILLTNDFQTNLREFLSLLPHDPSLKTRNKQVKSVKFFISSLIIQRFPKQVLQENDSSPDEGPEAVRCIHDAKLLVFAFRRFCHSIHRTFKEFR